jgi:hypothetical protein
MPCGRGHFSGHLHGGCGLGGGLHGRSAFLSHMVPVTQSGRNRFQCLSYIRTKDARGNPTKDVEPVAQGASHCVYRLVGRILHPPSKNEEVRSIPSGTGVKSAREHRSQT